MNKLLTKAAKLLLGLSLAAGVGVAIGSKAAERADAALASPYVVTLDNHASGNNNVHLVSGSYNSFSYGDASWSIATEWAASSYYGTNRDYAQWGSKNNPADSITISSSSFANKTIKNVTVNGNCTSNVGPKISISAGGTSIISDVSLVKTTATDYKSATDKTIPLGSTGEVVIEITSSLAAGSGAGVCIYSITVDWENSAAAKTILPTSLSITDQNSNVISGTKQFDGISIGSTIQLGKIAEFQSGSDYQDGLDFQWTSGSTDVATISNNGLVTVVSKGTTLISVSNTDATNSANNLTASFTLDTNNALSAKGEGADNPYTVTEAWNIINALSSSGYTGSVKYVKGTVAGTISYNESHSSHSFDLTDGTKTIKAYSIGGGKHSSGGASENLEFDLNYTVVVSGSLIKYNSSTYEVGYKNASLPGNLESSQAPTPKEIESITLSDSGVAKTYYDNDPISTDGIVATAHYTSNEYEDEVVTTLCTITADPTNAYVGLTKVTYSAVYNSDNTIVINDLEVTLTSVTAVVMDELQRSATNFKKDFTENEKFSFGGAKVYAHYNNGSKVELILGTTAGFTAKIGSTEGVGGTDITHLTYYITTEDVGSEVWLEYQGFHLSYTIDSVTAASGGASEGYYEKVTGTVSLNDKIVIVNESAEVALSTTQNTNNRGQEAVTIENDIISSVSTNVEVLTVVEGNSANTFGLKTSNNQYLYAASNSSNYLKTKSTLDDNGSWTISISNGTASIIAQGTNTHNVMQYNSGSSCFACYTSASQKAIQIYRFVNDVDEDLVALVSFLKETLYLDSSENDYININDHSDGTSCVSLLDDFIEFFNDDDYLSNSQRKTFAEITSDGEFVVARGKERVDAWAAHQNKVVNYAATTYKISLTNAQSANMLLSTNHTNNNNTIAIIVIISLVSVTAIGGYFFIKRREEN